MIIPNFQLKKESPPVSKTAQLKNNFLNLFSGNLLDPRSPTTLINRTPIIWKNKVSPTGRAGEFAELVNDSVISDVSMEILTKEEEESLPSLKEEAEKNNLSKKETSQQQEIDPRSPTIGIARTPLVLEPEKKKDQDNLLKNVTEKLISTALFERQKQPVEAEVVSEPEEKIPVVTKRVQLIYEDFDDVRFSTPPKSKKPLKNQENRTPLSCLGNKTPSAKPYPQINSSTPIKSKNPGINIFPDENSMSVEYKRENRSRIPVLSAKKIH